LTNRVRGGNTVSTLEKTEFILVCVIAVIFCFFTFYLLIKSKKAKRAYERKIKVLEKEIRFDYLTGVLSRKAFIAEMQEELAATGVGSLLIFDVNGFKSVNDTFGHAAGDEFIKRFGSRLSKTFDKELVGRLGGDEFVVFIKGKCDKEKINNIIKKSGAAEFYDKPTKFTLSSCCGIAAAPENGSTFDELYLAADKALYRSKSSEHRIVYYNPQQ